MIKIENKLSTYTIFRDPPILQAHNNTDIILRLPMGKRIRDIRWLSVWCRRFTVSHFLISLEIKKWLTI